MAYHFALTPTSPGMLLANTDDLAEAENLAFYYFRYGGKNGAGDSIRLRKSDLRTIVVAAADPPGAATPFVYWFLPGEASDAYWLKRLGLSLDDPRLLHIGVPRPLAKTAALIANRPHG